MAKTDISPHLLYGDSKGIVYVKCDKINGYLLIEKIKFGKKIDVKSISSKYYDEIVLNSMSELFADNGKSNDIIKQILKDKMIIPEVEFTSIVDENDLYIKKETKILNNLEVVISIKREILDNNYKFSSYFELESFFAKDRIFPDFCVYKHFDLIRKNNELLLDRLNLLDDVTCCEKNSSKRRVRKF